MDHSAVKLLHVTCVVVSISLFTLRGALQLRGTPWRQWKILRFAPHVIDTLLLGSALWLAFDLQQYPFVHGWLTAKVLALLAYILLGRQALRAGTRHRAAYFIAALLSVGYIVGVALTRSPSWGGL